ncbi:MAG: chromosome segregation protein SMC [Candidatus Thorarchaeota archaeon]|nr:MAG: chromosome segregation protein SMC [Candidatus Thorarchaeota archaeon]
MDWDLVHIEKLVCKGFKSFGRDTVTIRLNPGFTCIVGPNGSGKSNVIDAILFVLGQLSAKTLRANVFSDLLYSPPKANMPPKAKSAKVELHFNNADRKLQIESDKVVIERELDDTGKSICRINGKVVTRSAVLDVLGAIGVDPNGYNLVLQGEIAQMVKVSPNERRKLIEEIAGISAYDEQKEKALKKLAESETNLGKVDMQLQERRRQLEKLEEERAGALRHREINEDIKRVKIDILAWTIIKAKSRIGAINQTQAQRAEEAEKLVREFLEVETGISKTECEIEEIDHEIDQITGGDSAHVSEQYGIVSAALNHVKTDLERAQDEYDRALSERAKLQEDLRATQSEINENENLLKKKEDELDALDRKMSSTAAEIIKLEEMIEKTQADYYEATLRLQDLNNQMRHLDEGVSEVRSTIKSDGRELGQIYEELRDAKERLESTQNELARLRSVIPEKRAALEESEKLEASKREKIAEIETQLATADSEVTESAKIVSETREELIKVLARRDALKDAEDAFLKRRKALARVLELRNTGEVEGVHGTVAELGTIDPNYIDAMEVAGGNRLSYVVVENGDVATTCVEILKRERIGRTSFIPLDRIRTRGPGKIPKEDGVIDFALNLVKFEEKMRPAFEFVFTDTIVTENFETAKRLGFKGQRAVSLEGDLVEKSGLMTGGYYQRRGAGLSFQVEDNSSELSERLKGLEDIHSDLRRRQDTLRRQREELEDEIQELSNHNYRQKLELERLDEKLQELEFRENNLKSRIEEARVTIESLEEQIKTLQERDEELTVQRERVRAQRDEVNETLVSSDSAKTHQEIKNLREIQEHDQKKREKIQSEITSLRVAIDERLGPKAIELESRIHVKDEILPGLEEDVKRYQMALSERENEFQKLKRERDRIEEIVKDRRVKQIELKEHLRNLRLRHEEIRDAQTANEKAVYRLQTELNRLENEIVASTAELGQLSDVDEEIEERREERELTYREIEELEEKIRELERELEAMGPVNLKALTDYDIEKDRYEEIVDKKTKLEEERKEILAFMQELEAEKTQKFLTVYNEIADNFSKVFAKLSPGGEANLMLENPEHPLMGGITVRSKPRGKDLVTLDAMSGGEKTVTGLALIFAIQMYSPASFYVFDEIDAALDNVNAHNVALLISDMAKSSQFIVVSLRETTIRKADLLVGVSSQDGISRIVSVDLEEVAASS